MESIALWSALAMLIPGPGLLILSTSTRYGQVDSEFHGNLVYPHFTPKLTQHLISRAMLFCNALVGLYVSVAAFSLASLFGSIIIIWSKKAYTLVLSILCFFGIMALVYSTFTLIRESFSSLEVLKYHNNRMKRVHQEKYQ